MVKLLFFHLGVTNSKLKNIKLHLKLLTGKLKNKILISNHNHSRFTLFVPIFARTNFRALAQKIRLGAKISTEFTLKKATREI